VGCLVWGLTVLFFYLKVFNQLLLDLG